MNPYPKQKAWRSNKYLDYIRKQPCIITGQLAEPHHVKIKGNSGTSRKPSDYYCLPVNRKIHDEWERETNRYMADKYEFHLFAELFRVVSGFLKENEIKKKYRREYARMD